MGVQTIPYEIENRDKLFAQLSAEGKVIVEDVTIGLVDGRLSNCYCVVTDATEPGPENA